jgi:hypothetical protein
MIGAVLRSNCGACSVDKPKPTPPNKPRLASTKLNSFYINDVCGAIGITSERKYHRERRPPFDSRAWLCRC